MSRFIVSLALMVCLCLSGWAAAQDLPPAPETFHSPKGYTLHPPTGWSLVTAELRGQITDQAKAEYPALSGMDFSKIDAIFFGPIVDDFAVNINVVVSPATFRVNNDAVSQYTKQVKSQYASAGMRVSDMSVRTDKVNNLACLVSEHHMDMGGTRMKQWQYIVPAAKSAYTLTFTCQREKEEQFRPTVQAVMAGFGVDNPPSAFDLGSSTRTGIIVGAVVAGLIVSYFVRKKKQAR